jgi:hypothetical protein
VRARKCSLNDGRQCLSAWTNREAPQPKRDHHRELLRT